MPPGVCCPPGGLELDGALGEGGLPDGVLGGDEEGELDGDGALGGAPLGLLGGLDELGWLGWLGGGGGVLLLDEQPAASTSANAQNATAVRPTLRLQRRFGADIVYRRLILRSLVGRSTVVGRCVGSQRRASLAPRS